MRDIPPHHQPSLTSESLAPGACSSGMTSGLFSSSQSRSTWRLISGTPIRMAIRQPPTAAGSKRRRHRVNWSCFVVRYAPRGSIANTSWLAAARCRPSPKQAEIQALVESDTLSASLGPFWMM